MDNLPTTEVSPVTSSINEGDEGWGWFAYLFSAWLVILVLIGTCSLIGFAAIIYLWHQGNPRVGRFVESVQDSIDDMARRLRSVRLNEDPTAVDGPSDDNFQIDDLDDFA